MSKSISCDKGLIPIKIDEKFSFLINLLMGISMGIIYLKNQLYTQFLHSSYKEIQED